MATARWTILGSSPRTSLVLQRGNRQRTLSAIRLRDKPPPRWLRPIRSPMDPVVQVLDPAIEVCLVVLPRHPVRSGCGIPPQGIERRPQHRGIDMVEKPVNRFFFTLLCSFPTGSRQPGGRLLRSSACDTLARSCARRVRCCPAFPSALALGSTRSASGCPDLFAGFAATMARSDFSPRCIVGFGSSPSRRGPAACATGQG
jgi:hypothetical protein